jgi:hypothetical protein
MTDTGADVTGAEERRPEDTGAETGSRLQQYRKRTEEWASALRDGAEQHAPPEVLSGLARTAKNVAEYFEGMAERARVKQAKEEAAPEPTPETAEPTEAETLSDKASAEAGGEGDTPSAADRPSDASGPHGAG